MKRKRLGGGGLQSVLQKLSHQLIWAGHPPIRSTSFDWLPLINTRVELQVGGVAAFIAEQCFTLT